MFSADDVSTLRQRHPHRQFYVHDGYDGWSYGVPLNACLITDNTVRQLLNVIAAKTSESNVRDQLERGATALQYADFNHRLYVVSQNNRFLGFTHPDECNRRDENNDVARGPLNCDPLDF